MLVILFLISKTTPGWTLPPGFVCTEVGGAVSMNEKAIGQLSGLAGRLVAEGLISAQAASQAQKDASLERMPFVQYLVEKKNVDGRRLAEVASHEFGVPLFDLKAFNRSNLPEGLVDVSLVTKHHALPLFRRGNRLFIAVSDPTNLAALDEIKFHTGINTDAILIEDSVLSKTITEWVDAQDQLGDGLSDLDSSDLDDIDVSAVSEGGEGEEGRATRVSTKHPSCASSTRC